MPPPKRTRESLALELSGTYCVEFLTDAYGKRRKVSKHLPHAELTRTLEKFQKRSAPSRMVWNILLQQPAFWQTMGSVYSIGKVAKLCTETRLSADLVWNSILPALAQTEVRKAWCVRRFKLTEGDFRDAQSLNLNSGGCGSSSYEYYLLNIQDVQEILTKRYGPSLQHVHDGVKARIVQMGDRKQKVMKTRQIKVEQERERQEGRCQMLHLVLIDEEGFQPDWTFGGFLYNDFISSRDDDEFPMDVRDVAKEIAFRYFIHNYMDYNKRLEGMERYPGVHADLRDDIREELNRNGTFPTRWPWQEEAV
eukprot:795806-Rhodomonas_salina.1